MLYAEAHGIKKPLEEHKRCWRFDYADRVSFHIDALPCLPEDAERIKTLVQFGVDPFLAQSAIALTCQTHDDYKVLS